MREKSQFTKLSSCQTFPLYAKLTQKDVEFLWKPVHHDSFCKLKQLLVSAPEFDRSLILETEASGVGLDTILAQSHENRMMHTIAYANRILQ